MRQDYHKTAPKVAHQATTTRTLKPAPKLARSETIYVGIDVRNANNVHKKSWRVTIRNCRAGVEKRQHSR